MLHEESFHSFRQTLEVFVVVVVVVVVYIDNELDILIHNIDIGRGGCHQLAI